LKVNTPTSVGKTITLPVFMVSKLVPCIMWLEDVLENRTLNRVFEFRRKK
jgi:hypothetical protein